MRLAVLAGCLIALLAASSAQAGWKTDRANLIAYEVWGDALSAPCPHGLELRYDDPARFGFDDEGGGGWATFGVCVVYLDVNDQDMRAWEPLCDVFLHEAGHVAGYNHDHTGHGGVMRPHYSFTHSRGWVARHGKRVRVDAWEGTDHRCRDRGRPFLTRAARDTAASRSAGH